jgi:amino acid adenylation domain-containing protein
VTASTVVLPASFAQRRLWFLDRLDPGLSTYSVPTGVRMRGVLDVGVLTGCLGEIVARHEVLRTTFGESDGEPVQIISEPSPVSLPVQDIEGDPDTAVRQALLEDASATFDLARGPLVRFRLLRVSPMEHVLLVVAHHSVIDGWSLGVFYRELSLRYAGAMTGKPVDLPELDVQYGDFAAWQRENLTAEKLPAESQFWQEALAGAPAVLDLPSQFPKPARASAAGTVASLRLRAELTGELDELAESESITLFMLLLAAFEVLLHRYCGVGDLVVGCPVAGRIRPELEPLIGCFINTLPLRARMTRDVRFTEFLGQTRAVVLAAYDHQNLSFEHIVDLVRPNRGTGDTPIFQVMFAVDNTPPPADGAGALKLDFLPSPRVWVKYALNVTVHRDGDELDLAMEYRSDLFTHEWSEWFLGAYQRLLESSVADPTQPIGELAILTAAQRRQLLYDWNDTDTPFPDRATVDELIDRQIEDSPDAVALAADGTCLTYRELGARADEVADRLYDAGLEPGDRVGLCMLRSVEMVVALLGVLKAGMTYVPLEPSYPEGRLRFLVEDAGLTVVLTHPPASERVPDGVITVLTVDAGVVAGPVSSRSRRRCGAEDGAYLIYTSGSTGIPKGVVTSHRALANRLVWMQREYQLDSSDVVLQKTPYSFDVSVWEFLWPLLAGARLVLARPDGHKDPRYLHELIQAEQVSTLHFVPSMLQVFLEAVDLGECGSLRRVICSGEVLPADVVQRFLAVAGNCALHNLYGPTEAAIDVSSWPCSTSQADSVVPIGRPIANTRLYVLDDRGEPVPPYVTGNLHIAGVQVAAGYLNRPELTAERFVEDPFAGGPMYRTGDLARWRADGALEFLGRRDSQVKVRGFRIELGEIEVALRALPSVADAVVTVWDERLVGYLVCDQPDRPSTAAIRAHLAGVLPEYMVPAAIEWLTEIPLSPNGKADRAALPKPSGQPMVRHRVAARDGLELRLVALWEDLLGVSPIGVTDDFFEMGGSSLLVIRLLGQIAREYGRELPVSVMFSGGATVERLASELRGNVSARIWSPIVTLRAGSGTRRPLFCLPPAVGNVLSYLDLVRQLPGDQPVYGLQSAGLDQGQEPIGDLAEAVGRFAEAIQEVQPAGPYRLVGYCVGSISAFAVAQRLRAQGEHIELLAVIDGGPTSEGTDFDEADEADIAAWFAWELGRAGDRRLVLDPAELRTAAARGGLAQVLLDEAVAADVLPPDTGLGQLSRLLATFETGVRAARSYRLRPFDGPIIAFRAADEPMAESPVPRWKRFARGGLSIRDLPGDHYTLMRPPGVQALAAVLTQLLDTPDKDGGPADRRTMRHESR